MKLAVSRGKRSLAVVPAALLLAFAAPAAAADATTAEVSGTGCPAGATVVLAVTGQPFTTTEADRAGRFSSVLHLPADIRTPSVSASCGGRSFTLALPARDDAAHPSHLAQALLASGAAAVVAVLITLLRRRAAVIDLRDRERLSGPSPETMTGGPSKVSTP